MACELRNAIVTLTLMAAGCAADTEPMGLSSADSRAAPILRWVGVIEQTDVRVAVIAGKGKIRLFFCGGEESFATATRWFNVGWDGGEHIELTEDAWAVHAHVTFGGLMGDVKLGDDVTRRMRAGQVVPTTLAGVYEGEADCGRLGLIVTQATANATPTALGACVANESAPPQPVQPISPIVSVAGKLGVSTPGADSATSWVRLATID